MSPGIYTSTLLPEKSVICLCNARELFQFYSSKLLESALFYSGGWLALEILVIQFVLKSTLTYDLPLPLLLESEMRITSGFSLPL